MTELDESNRKRYLEIVSKIWDLDEKSMDFIKVRTTDEWQPAPEYQEYLKAFKYENQRYRIPVDFKNPMLSKAIKEFDESYRLFTRYFKRPLEQISVSYEDFLNNKIVYNKNITKIKKVFEKWYLEHYDYFCREAGEHDLPYETGSRLSDEKKLDYINKYITKAYEKIGEKKRPSKNGLSLVISFNPCDWFLASTSESHFSSCFNLNDIRGGSGYRFSLGLPFLNTDKNRCFVYLTRGEMKEWEGIKVESVLARTWAFLDTDKRVDICKWYPNEIFNAEALNIALNLKMFRSGENFRRGLYPIEPISTKTGAIISVYNDLGHWKFDKESGMIIHEGNGKDGQQVFTKRGTRFDETGDSTYNLNPPSALKFIYSRWLKTGLSLSKMFTTYRCNICGSEEKAGFFRDNDFYCYDCFEDHRKRCSRCGNEYWEDFSKPKKALIFNRNGDRMDFCPRCDEYARQHICSICGTYDEDAVTVDGKRVCNSCINKPSSKYIRCSNGKVILKENAYMVLDKENNRILIQENPNFEFDNCEDHMGANISPIIMRYRNGAII